MPIHCDLKSMNILISEVAKSENAKHYVDKVADFGSARSGNSSAGSTGFIAGQEPTYIWHQKLYTSSRRGISVSVFLTKLMSIL